MRTCSHAGTDDNVDQRITRLEKKAEQLAAALREKVLILSEKRRAGAERLGHLAEKELWRA